MKLIIRHLPLLLTFVFCLFLFWPTFQLALFGDDWLAIWNYQSVRALGSTSFLKHLFSLYGPQEILMWGMTKIFGYDGTAYYLLSFLLRMLAAFSLYPLTIHFTRNKLAAFFPTLFFAVTFIGLEATNWVFNMNAYLAIALMSFSLYFFLKSKTKRGKGEMFFSLTLFYLAHVIAPSRVTFFILIVFVLDLIGNSEKIKFNSLFKRQLPFILVFIFARFTGNYGVDYFSSMIWNNLVTGKYNLQFLKQISITLGSLVIPETYLPNKQLGILGVLFFLSVCFFLYKYWSEKERGLILLSLLFLATGIATPVILWPNLQYSSIHRHLLLAAPGIALLSGSLISLARKKGAEFLTIASLLFLLILQAHAVDQQLLLLKNTRSEVLENTIWNQLLQIMPNPQPNPHPFVFYFEADPESTTTLSDLVYFGFPSKVGVLYNISRPEELPTPVSRFEELTEILKRGRYLGGEVYQDVPPENIYAYRLEKKDSVRDITEEIRLKLNN